jgi:hypothetical protein
MREGGNAFVFCFLFLFFFPRFFLSLFFFTPFLFLFFRVLSFSSSSKSSGESVSFGDQNVTVHVHSSNRFRTSMNKPLSNYKKSSSSIIGGYICSDGSGFEHAQIRCTPHK